MTDPRPWTERHANWAAGAALACAVAGVWLIFHGYTLAAAKPADPSDPAHLAGCVRERTVVVAPASPTAAPATPQAGGGNTRDSQPEPTTSETRTEQTTCQSPGLAGPVLILLLLGTVLALPVVRLLIMDLEFSLGPLALKRTPAEPQDKVGDTFERAEAEWAGVSETQLDLLVEVKTLRSVVESDLASLRQTVNALYQGLNGPPSN